MVTATIQADLKSDNFLIVCTALQAISRCAGPELVTVFLPQVVAALRHDRDYVKKKALLALHRLLQLDSSIAPDVERHLIDKLGYKEPSVMVAALCGLHELARANPTPYRNLVHYFTNILKQASEGKLGRGWDYHRAPAPFVQIELLRLLALLGTGDEQASENMKAIIIEVWRRADALASTVGNALVFECVKVATTIHLDDSLLAMSLQSAQRFLNFKDNNNLRCAGIDILSRLVDGDPARVEQYQLAIVECLRSPDVTLKRRTLDLLFKMAGPGNVEVVAEEVLAYLKEGGDDVGPRRQAAVQLVEIAEDLAPSSQWFVNTMTSLLEGSSSDVAPAKAADALLKVVAEGIEGEDLGVHAALERSVVNKYLALLDRPKLPSLLLRVACLILGQYSLQAGQSYATIVDKLVGIMETQAVNESIQTAIAGAIVQLAVRAGKPLPSDAAILLEGLTRSECLEVQQVAAEMSALLKASVAAQRAVLSDKTTSSTKVVGAGAPLQCLDAYVRAAEIAGAPPYLSLEDRVAMGVTRNPHTLFPAGLGGSGGGMGRGASATHGALKFQAYERAHQPTSNVTALSSSSAPVASAAAASAGMSLFDDLDLGGLVVSEVQPAVQQQAQQAVQSSPRSAVAAEEQQLKVNKSGGRKWGPQAQQPPSPAPSAAAAPPSSFSSASRNTQASPREAVSNSTTSPKRNASTAAATLDPAQQRLAASLFGKGAGSSRGAAGSVVRGATRSSTAKAPEADLLGDLMGSSDTTTSTLATTQPTDPMAALAGLDVMSGFGSSPPVPPVATSALDFDLLGGPVARPAQLGQQPPLPQRGGNGSAPPRPPQDPFANLLD
jgi:AP-4 complex subunit epsilon-1